MSKSIGTILVNKKDAKDIVAKAINNISIAKKYKRKHFIAKWQKELNDESIKQYDRWWNKFIKKDGPAKYTEEETIYALDLRSKEWQPGSWKYSIELNCDIWGASYQNAKSIDICCDSEILEPLTISIEVWTDLVLIASFPEEIIDEKMKRLCS